MNNSQFQRFLRERRYSKRVILVGVAALVLLGLLHIVLVVRLAKQPSRGSTDSDRTTVPTKTQLLPFAIRPQEIDPGQITVPAGRYALMISNRSSLRDIAVVLDRVGVGRVKEVKAPSAN